LPLVDLEAAARTHITVAEVTGSNSIRVAEHVVMMVLSLVRNYLPSHEIAVRGGWNIADCVSRSYDAEGMHFGTIAAGRIGLAVLRQDAESLVRAVDIVNLQMPMRSVPTARRSPGLRRETALSPADPPLKAYWEDTSH
jgi:formate dehydrogenase